MNFVRVNVDKKSSDSWNFFQRKEIKHFTINLISTK